jgi:hypothetical protein
MGILDHLRAVPRRLRAVVAGSSTDEPELTDEPFERGEIVRDRDSDTEKELIVVGTRKGSAETFVVPGTETTVAEYNSDYPARDCVIEVRFVETLDAYLDGWTVAGVLETEATGKLDAGEPYFYPASRLVTVEQPPVG